MRTNPPCETALRCRDCGSVWLSVVAHELMDQLGGCLLCGRPVVRIPRPDAS